MKLKFSPAPSPNGTNHEKLFLVRLGRKGPAGAYDEELDTAALRVKVGKLLAKHLDGHAYANSIDTMNNLFDLLPAELGAHQADDEDDENDDTEADIDSAVERILGFIKAKLGGDRARAADLDVAKALVRDQFHQRRLSRDRARRLSRDRARARARDMDRPLPRSGTEGGIGGRLSEDRRRRMASDQSYASAIDLFPEAARIKNSGGHC